MIEAKNGKTHINLQQLFLDENEVILRIRYSRVCSERSSTCSFIIEPDTFSRNDGRQWERSVVVFSSSHEYEPISQSPTNHRVSWSYARSTHPEFTFLGSKDDQSKISHLKTARSKHTGSMTDGSKYDMIVQKYRVHMWSDINRTSMATKRWTHATSGWARRWDEKWEEGWQRHLFTTLMATSMLVTGSMTKDRSRCPHGVWW